MISDYVMADDLSGALEAGAAFCARGWRVTLQLDTAVAGAAEAGTLTLLSTETRNVCSAAAATLVRRLLARQRAAGARLLFKKIDSTLRGPVGVEIKAVLDELAPKLVVVCSANPAVGRTVRDGVLLVNGVPVADTEFRHDPGWPVTESRIAVALAGGGVGPVSLLSLARLRGVRQLRADDCRGVLVSDAETEGDLEHLVDLVRRQEPNAVFVGAGGLAHALAAGASGRERTGSPAKFKPTSVLIVSGSMSAESRRQLEVLRDCHGVPLHEVRLDLDEDEQREFAENVARSLASRGVAALTTAIHPLATDPTLPVKRLVSVVAMLSAAKLEPEMLAATGGETAQALCTCLGIGHLQLVNETEPGVVMTRVMGRGHGNLKWVVIKPGSFGSNEVWSNIFRI